MKPTAAPTLVAAWSRLIAVPVALALASTSASALTVTAPSVRISAPPVTEAVLWTVSTLTATAAATPTPLESELDSELEVSPALEDSSFMLGSEIPPPVLGLFAWVFASSSAFLPPLSESFAPPALAVTFMVLDTVAAARMVALPWVAPSSPRLRAVLALAVSLTTTTPMDTPTATLPAASAFAVVVTWLVWLATIARFPVNGAGVPASVPTLTVVWFVMTATAAPMPTAASLPDAPFSASVRTVCTPVAVTLRSVGLPPLYPVRCELSATSASTVFLMTPTATEAPTPTPPEAPPCVGAAFVVLSVVAAAVIVSAPPLSCTAAA